MIEITQVDDKQASKRKFIAITVAVSASVIAAVVMAFITTKIQKKNTPDLVAKVVLPEQAAVPEMKKFSMQRLAKQSPASSASAMSASMVRANTNAVIATPEVPTTDTTLMGFGTGDLGAGFGSGRGNGMGGGGVGSMGAVRRIGGVSVRADKLGVILDTSGSMTRYLDDLRGEIREKFKDAVFREVVGCSVRVSSGYDEEQLKSLDENNFQRRSVMNAVKELVEVSGVDAIFWFSDLNDSRSEAGLEELEKILLNGARPRKMKQKGSALDWLKKQKSMGSAPEMRKEPCRLYIQTVGHKPDDPLEAIVEATGGESELKK